MKLKTILKYIPPFDMIISHYDIYEEFKDEIESNFHEKEGHDLIELYLSMNLKTGSVFFERGEYVRDVLDVLEQKVIKENRDELEQIAMEHLQINKNNEVASYLREIVAYRKVSKPGPLDCLVEPIMNPVQTYKKMKYVTPKIYNNLKFKGRKTLEFFSEFGKLF